MLIHETRELRQQQHLLILQTIEALKATAQTEKRKKAYERDWVISRILWKTLQRIGAILKLQDFNIDFSERKIFFTADKSKVKKTHVVKMDDELCELLSHWISDNRYEIQKHGGYLFFSSFTDTYKPLNYATFWENYDRYAEAAGIQATRWITAKGHRRRTVHPHTNRGGGSTHLLRLNVNPAMIQKLIGCSFQTISRHYDKLTRDEAQEKCIKLL